MRDKRRSISIERESKEGVRVEKERFEKECEYRKRDLRRSVSIERDIREGVREEKARVEKRRSASRERVRVEECD